MSTAKLKATPKAEASQDEADIRALIAAGQRALYDKDANAAAAPFATDAAVFDLAPPLAHRGIDVEEKKAWFETWDGPIGLEARDFEITVSGDLAFGHGFYRMSGTKRIEGKISFWMRATVCLRRGRDGWRIVHEHTSVPFYMDGSLRPAFDLKP